MPSNAGRTNHGNLTADLTSFVGRQREGAELKRMLESARLVTVTGVGGIGKTRFARQVAGQVRRLFPDGVWFAGLAALEDPGLVAGQVGLALGLRDHSGRTATEVVTAYLSDKQLLLVIDNCEHLLDGVARLLADVLPAAPDIRVIATSRQRLGIAGEHVMTLESLSMPDPNKPPPPPLGFAQYEALTLFVDRAQSASANFTITPTNHTAVVALCRALDGLPLAIELAAVRLRMLSPEQILSRLDDRFTLLETRDQSLHPRQRNLGALIDWSFDLCTPDEKLLWIRLSVLPGAFDLDTAIGICADEQLSPVAVLNALDGLLDRSILIPDDQGRPRMRYRAIETIREYGLAQIVDPEQRFGLRRRHFEYFLRLAKDAETEWCGPHQKDWIARLLEDHDNLRAALVFSLTGAADEGRGLDLAGTLWLHWLLNGLLSEGRQWMDRVLATTTKPSREYARALWTDANLRLHQGDIAGALAQLERSSHVAATIDDEDALAHVVECRGVAALLSSDWANAAVLSEQAVTMHAALGNHMSVILALARWAMAAYLLGDTEQASACHAESLALSEARGETWGRSTALWIQGVLLTDEGDLAAAKSALRESLRIRHEFDDRLGVAQCIEVLAWIAAAEQSYVGSARLLGIVETLWISTGGKLFPHVHDRDQRCREDIERALGAQGFADGIDEGRRLQLDEGVHFAMGTQPTVSAHDAIPASPLTRREQQIAILVAEGLSNRVIASKLVISQRTAEAHVEHVLIKLGFNSRAQIAAWVVEQRAVQ